MSNSFDIITSKQEGYSMTIQTTIHVNVESCVEIAAVTDAATWDELLANIREVIKLHLEDSDTVTEFNLIANPRIIITMELPENYAEIA
jgi:predicted RNase H-like HicB family nuclease